MPDSGASSATSERARLSADGERRKRQHQVLVRLSDAEHADLTRLAETTGQSLPALLRAGLHHFTPLEGS